MTGGTVISEQLGRGVAEAEVQDMGRARTFRLDKGQQHDHRRQGRPGRGGRSDPRGAALLDLSKSDWDTEKLQERLGKLSNSVAVIKVGAATEVELKERKHRVEDALSATRAAVEEGIVPGGGVALIAAAKTMQENEYEGDERTAVRILRRSLEEPLRRIASNAGKDGSVIVQEVKEADRSTGATTRSRTTSATWSTKA